MPGPWRQPGRPSAAQRIAHEARPNPEAFALDLVELRAGQHLRIADLAIEAVEVDHRPVAPALGFVFTDGRHKLALSGDTRPSPALIEAARDSDLLVHEVFAHAAMQPKEGVRSRATIEAVESYHTLSTDLGGIARAASARALLLTHIVPPDADPFALIQDIRATYSGPSSSART
jgi:ribonuclease Z